MFTKISELFFLLMIAANIGAYGQAIAKRTLPAVRSSGTITIDGLLKEADWHSAPLADSFIQMRPNAGQPENPNNKTEVYVLYNNHSVYIAGFCHETSKDSIYKELVGRDRVGSNDFIGVVFDTYNDKINGSGFYVTPLGEQYDAKYSNVGNEDDSWDAVWYAATHINDSGWTFEMRIPYSALRFSKNTSTWGINFTRRRSKSGQQYTWNLVNPNVTGFVNQSGLWTGISNIEPPLRLSFSPYLSSYLNHYPYHNADIKNTTVAVNGGMDVKYGINQNFTLDVTLIPDFGQVASDKKVLNLTPFETKYNENRPFFTEGTELFTKGNLFYSRRIGAQPLHKFSILNQLDSNEVLINNPSESKLINASKISGRTQKGLGIGVFNAITKPMYARVENLSTHHTRKIQTASLTNYNILVIDQTLKNASSISLVNTNVWRSGKDYEANVTAAVFDLYNKNSIYNLWGQVAISQKINAQKNVVGYAHSLGFGKTGGRFNFKIEQEVEDDEFDKNDLGILFNNNSLEHSFWAGYKFLKATQWYQNLYVNFNAEWEHRFTDAAYQSFETNVNANAKLKNLWQVNALLAYQPQSNDFYEPRQPGKVFKSPGATIFETWVSTNETKKYYADVMFTLVIAPMYRANSIYTGWGQRFRFSDKFSVGTNFTFKTDKNDVGFAAIDANTQQSIFSRRLRKTSENEINFKYSFSNKASLNFQARHYWSQVKAKEFYTLNNDGSLSPTQFLGNGNYNLNYFNIDMVYTWQFAAGSFLNLVWKNQIIDEHNQTQYNYFKNLDRVFRANQNNTLSVKVLFYFDYLNLKRKK